MYLVRHARAGSRRDWKKDDTLRPLSKAGQAQAKGIAATLSGRPIDRIVTSPYARCVQSVEPLSAEVGVPIETSDAIADGMSLAQALPLVEKLEDEQAVVCTHGDVLHELLDHFARHGAKLHEHRAEKGSIWALDIADGEVVDAQYIPPQKRR